MRPALLSLPGQLQAPGPALRRHAQAHAPSDEDVGAAQAVDDAPLLLGLEDPQPVVAALQVRRCLRPAREAGVQPREVVLAAVGQPRRRLVGEPVVTPPVGPLPAQPLPRPQGDLHAVAADVGTAPRARTQVAEQGGGELVGPQVLGAQDAVGVGALHQVVVARDLGLAGHGAVVPHQHQQVLVAVEEVVGAIEEHLGGAVAVGQAPADLQPRPLPQVGHGEGGVPAQGVAVDVEHLHRVLHLVRTRRRVVAPPPGELPDGARLLRLRHLRLEDPREDVVHRAPVAPAVDEDPGIHDLVVAHVLHQDVAVRLPRLAVDAVADGVAGVGAVDGAAHVDAPGLAGLGDDLLVLAIEEPRLGACPGRNAEGDGRGHQAGGLRVGLRLSHQ